MRLNRRDFLWLGATALAGCASPQSEGGGPAAGSERVVNAGPAGLYLKDGVYTRYRDLGFFIVRRGASLYALSAICTHRRCKLEVERDRTFSCPCHDSTFDENGRATKGPATRDLPRYAISINQENEAVVSII